MWLVQVSSEKNLKFLVMSIAEGTSSASSGFLKKTSSISLLRQQKALTAYSQSVNNVATVRLNWQTRGF
jgi:hypothetical protein